jgi:hypothetical protein
MFPILTANIWRSLLIASLAEAICFLPFTWSLWDTYLEATSPVTTPEIMAQCLDSWLLGNIAAGVVASVNWAESKIDFQLGPFSDALAFFSAIGSINCLALYVVLHGRGEELLSNIDHFRPIMNSLYAVGMTNLFVTLVSILQCRREKDTLTTYVRV